MISKYLLANCNLLIAKQKGRLMTHQLVIDDLFIDMDISLIRRLNLKAVCDNAVKMGIAKNVTHLCRIKDIDPSYVSQLINGHRNLAEKSARNLEDKLGLKSGALDDPDLNFGSDSTQISDNSHKNIEIAKKIGYQLNRWVPVRVYSRMNAEGFFTETKQDGTVNEGYIPSLTASSSAYAIKATGGSMHPAVRDGWFVVCDPESQLVATEYVQVKLRSGMMLIREFIHKTNDMVILQNVSTGSRETLESIDVESITAIIDIVPPSRFMAQIPVMTITNSG